MKPITLRRPHLHTSARRPASRPRSESRTRLPAAAPVQLLSRHGYLPRISYIRAFALLAIIAVLVVLAATS